MYESLTEMERRWISCGDQRVCQVMADVPHPELVRLVDDLDPFTHVADRSWLQVVLSRVSGPPGMELRTFSDVEIEKPLDHYAMLLRVPMPDSYDPSRMIPVGRLGYSYGAAKRDEQQVFAELYQLGRALVLHELDEWYRVDSVHYRDPHPEGTS